VAAEDRGDDGPLAPRVRDVVPGHPSIEIALADLPGQRSAWNPSEGRLLIDARHADPDALGRAIASALCAILAGQRGGEGVS
jgi:hypothetical protein